MLLFFRNMHNTKPFRRRIGGLITLCAATNTKTICSTSMHFTLFALSGRDGVIRAEMGVVTIDISQSIYEKKGCILFVQTDHISGEVIGTVIEDFYKAGAFNVQVIPSVTKKNRPGYLFFIDTAPEGVADIESLIVSELGATGWHRLESAHRHVATEIQKREVVFDTPRGAKTYIIMVKLIKSQPDRPRPEHASCLEVRESLRENGVFLSLSEVNQAIINQLFELSQ